MLLGCIADDLTGATDLALMLTRAGMRTVQVMQVPDASTSLAGFDAVVVALKTRTCPPAEAVSLSLAAADALLAGGARQLFFKYCSTLSERCGVNSDRSRRRATHSRPAGGIVCPAFPQQADCLQGNLVVGDVPPPEPRGHPRRHERFESRRSCSGRQAQCRTGRSRSSMRRCRDKRQGCGRCTR